MARIIIILAGSALFRALTQIMVWAREEQSWLPGWIFRWDWGFWSTADAYHVYQWFWEMMLAAGWMLIGGEWLRFRQQQYLSTRAGNRMRLLLLSSAIWLIYYMVFNLFYHIIFIKPEFWRWPVG